ncbi:MAG: SagB/ThcOx family dehydrogenase [Mailhella sp.]|nr:SagB/ThcOx family dehydrogenase [Mailhella sp.]
MDRRDFLLTGSAVAAVAFMGPGLAFADGGALVMLPRPDIGGGKPLMACLARRRSSHVLGRGDVDLPSLGALLWAAWGVNRDDGKHVVPTALNKQQAMVFAVRGDGVWEYLPKEHAIKKVLEGDRRRSFDGAGLVLLYAAPVKERFSAMHVGSMYQNAGLFCASAGLDNCVKFQKHDALDAELPLPEGWATFITQSIAPRDPR